VEDLFESPIAPPNNRGAQINRDKRGAVRIA
jgi:hypothetical protein